MTIEIPTKPTESQAEFNDALALLERIHKTETAIEYNLITWELWDALNFLESYENELCFCFKEGEQEEVDKMKKEIIDYFNKYPGLGQVRKGCGNKYIAHSNISPIVRAKLIELNKFLRAIKHKRGMGMPKKGEGKLF